ncbi:VOC family protein [Sphingorhabdus sp.]|uniref:VOC family protein n=1 Tax=Sphingorhabdus sp. TaxID=1902408 RepID=UPI0032B7F94E
MALDFVQELTASMGATDLDRSIGWYEKILGCTLMYRVDEIGWCEMQTHMDGVRIGLSQNQSVVQGGGATNVWSVANIEAAKAHLDAHDVRQDGDIQHIPGLVKLLTFFDPDGNAMMFAESQQS